MTKEDVLIYRESAYFKGKPTKKRRTFAVQLLDVLENKELSKDSIVAVGHVQVNNKEDNFLRIGGRQLAIEQLELAKAAYKEVVFTEEEDSSMGGTNWAVIRVEDWNLTVKGSLKRIRELLEHEYNFRWEKEPVWQYDDTGDAIVFYTKIRRQWEPQFVYKCNYREGKLAPYKKAIAYKVIKSLKATERK